MFNRNHVLYPFFVLLCSVSVFLVMLMPHRAIGAGQSAPAFDAHLCRLRNSARMVGVEIVAVSSGRTVFEYRAKDALVPASLVKILTSYSALKQLGPQYRFNTTVWAFEKPQGDILSGGIWIRSEGDIFLVQENTRILAGRLKGLGLQRIEGGIFVDNGYFEPQSEQICLDGNCTFTYNPVISATALDFNTVTLRVDAAGKPGGPVRVRWFPQCDYVQVSNLALITAKPSKTPIEVQPLGTTEDGHERFQVSGRLPVRSSATHEYRLNVHDPESFFARSLKALLEQTGVEVNGATVGAGAVPEGAQRLIVHQSQPLGDLVYGLNRYSNNFMAEMLLRSMGARVMGAPGTARKGLAVIRKTLHALGIREAEAHLDNGSGLSRECRVSPDVFCRVLLSAYQDPAISAPFLSSLAVNGEDGTLRNRMCRPGVIIRGKTGTLNNVVGFAGYVEDPGKEIYAAVVLLNGIPNLGEARDAMDAFLEDVPAAAFSR
jgi:D-alanyl-D-alanine carboxypeptidase/D-alanyl-D-alanine-endopeptidase (penicillin-binding protein 4)